MTETKAAGLNPGHEDGQLAVHWEIPKEWKRVSGGAVEEYKQKVNAPAPAELNSILALSFTEKLLHCQLHSSPHSCSLPAFMFSQQICTETISVSKVDCLHTCLKLFCSECHYKQNTKAHKLGSWGNVLQWYEGKASGSKQCHPLCVCDLHSFLFFSSTGPVR